MKLNETPVRLLWLVLLMVTIPVASLISCLTVERRAAEGHLPIAPGVVEESDRDSDAPQGDGPADEAGLLRSF